MNQQLKPDEERRISLTSELKIERREGGPPKIVGHAAVFNQLSEDLGGFREMVAPGAFRESLEKDDIRALINHDSGLVVGRKSAGTLRLTEDARGLAIEVDPPDTSFARDLLVSLERGDVNQMSFGFSVRPNGQNWGQADDGQVVRTLTNVKLWDVSVVTFPAYPQTDVGLRSFQEWRKAKEAAPAWRTGVLRRRLALEEWT